MKLTEYRKMTPRRTSDVWNHFHEVEGERKAKCCYCLRQISFVSGNVGNLRRHIKLKHPSVKFVRPTPSQFANSFGPQKTSAHESQSSIAQPQEPVVEYEIVTDATTDHSYEISWVTTPEVEPGETVEVESVVAPTPNERTKTFLRRKRPLFKAIRPRKYMGGQALGSWANTRKKLALMQKKLLAEESAARGRREQELHENQLSVLSAREGREQEMHALNVRLLKLQCRKVERELLEMSGSV